MNDMHETPDPQDSEAARDDSSRRPSRGRRTLANLGWVLGGVVLAIFLLADPLDIHPLDSWLNHQLWRLHGGAGAGPGDAAGAAPASGERKILFYRNPMDPTITSPVPAKDSMGMDYVPVYADEAGAAAAGRHGGADRPGGRAEHERGDRAGRAPRPDAADPHRRLPRLRPAKDGLGDHQVPGLRREGLRQLRRASRCAAASRCSTIYAPELVQTQEELLSALAFAKRLADAPPRGPAPGRGPGRRGAPAARASGTSAARQIERLEASGKALRTLTVTAPASGRRDDAHAGPRGDGGRAGHGALPHRRPVDAVALGRGFRGPALVAAASATRRRSRSPTSPARPSTARCASSSPR